MIFSQEFHAVPDAALQLGNMAATLGQLSQQPAEFLY
jgi:hypothetical protein